MMLEEYLGKDVLKRFGLPVPPNHKVSSIEETTAACRLLGFPVMVKAQVPAGGRGKAGGIRRVNSEIEAGLAAADLLGSLVSGFCVEHLLVEPSVEHDQEYYVAVLDDPLKRSPVLLCCAHGGMDIEEMEKEHPGSVQMLAVSLQRGLDNSALAALVDRAGIPARHAEAVVSVLGALWESYRDIEAELVEVNPLVVDTLGKPWVLDAKVVLDEASIGRHQALMDLISAGDSQTRSAEGIEARARSKGLLFIELDGDIGIVANGAGLTMATLDVVSHYGGRAANFMEVGGDNYTKARQGVEVVLSNPRVRSLLVNFCGAFARTDVMAEGVVQALEARVDSVPVFFSIHGTGENEAVELVKSRLGITPYPAMDDAVEAAVRAAKEGAA